MPTITIHNAEDLEPSAILQAVMRARMDECDADIYVAPRVPADAPEYKHPGWLEYIIVLTYGSGRKFTVGMIQRKSGEPFEFHS